MAPAPDERNPVEEMEMSVSHVKKGPDYPAAISNNAPRFELVDSDIQHLVHRDRPIAAIWKHYGVWSTGWRNQ